MKKLILILIPVLILVLAGAGWMFMKGGGAEKSDPKTTPGPVATLSQPFIVNLADGPAVPRFVKMGVALRLAEASAGDYTPPAGNTPGALKDEPQVRDIIIATTQQRTSAALSTERGRDEMKKQLVKRINRETELRVLDVYYTDFAVQ